MSLKEKLADDMKTAMKAREAGKLRLSVIRMAKAAIQNEEIARGCELSDEDVLQVLVKEQKKRKDVIAEYERAGRDEMVATLKQEIEILDDYLPQQLSDEEIRIVVSRVIAEIGPQMGQVMKKVMTEVKGRADGKLVNDIVKAMLK
ncbi:MAG: GatB/YqeY domain-containing protein [Methylocystaceae bacterium]